ncbi:MAG TPA: hypothetical protein V6C69_02540 [Trichormus sp.]
MMQKSLLFLAAFAMIVLSAALVPSTGFHHLSTAAVISHGGGNVTVDVDHPPSRLVVSVGATITLTRFGGANGGSVTITSYNSDGQVSLVLSDLPGGPIGTVQTFRAERHGDAQIVIRYAPQGGFAQSAQITVSVR